MLIAWRPPSALDGNSKKSDPMLNEESLQIDMATHPPAFDDLCGGKFEREVENWEENPEFNILDFIGEEPDSQRSLSDDLKEKKQLTYQYNCSYWNNNYPNQSCMGSGVAAGYNHNGIGYDNGNFDGYDVPSSSFASNYNESYRPVTGYKDVKPEPFEDDMSGYQQDDEFVACSSASLVNPSAQQQRPVGSHASMPIRKPTRFQGSVTGLNIDPVVIQEKVNAVIKKPPRKYKMKPETEKVNPVYKQKRAKNNDAVRRSREKAKLMQQERDHKLNTLEENFQQLLDHVKQQNAYMIKHGIKPLQMPVGFE